MAPKSARLYISSVRKSFCYKAKLSPSVERKTTAQLALLCELYNAAIEERTTAWKRCGVSVSMFDQINQLTDIKKVRPEFAAIDSGAVQNAIQRVGRAFDGFFRRVKSGQAAGYPRFRSRSRYDSFTMRTWGWRLNGRRLDVNYLGTFRLFLSRPVEGTVKEVTIRRDRCGDWFVSFNCEDMPTRPLPDTGESVGVDVGLTHFAALSNGELIENPRAFSRAQAGLSIAQRRVAKGKRGGNNRRERARTVARKYRTVARVRRDFHFKTAVDLVRRFDVIAIEDLNVLGLSRSTLAKHVHDAGWGQFTTILCAKAEEAARTVVRVNPRNTSQVCSGCGCLPEIPKTLKVRTHDCEHCGLVLNRDVNAARNILRAGAQPVASRPASKAAA